MKQPILLADYFMGKTFIRLINRIDICDGKPVLNNNKEFSISIAIISVDKFPYTCSYYVDGKVNVSNTIEIKPQQKTDKAKG